MTLPCGARSVGRSGTTVYNRKCALYCLSRWCVAIHYLAHASVRIQRVSAAQNEEGAETWISRKWSDG
jgi:hypothetical protein